MPTTTRAVLRQRLSEAIGDYWTGTVYDVGSTTTLVDPKLADLTSDDDGIQGWVFITSADDEAPQGQHRRILVSGGYTASLKRLTVSRAFDTNAPAVGDTYELHRYNPDDLHNAINRSIELLYPSLYLPIRNETLSIDNQLINWDFETSSSGSFSNWTAVGPTTAVQTGTVMHGTKSASVAASGSLGYLWQDLVPNLKEITDRTIVFKCWVYTWAADSARIRIDWDGGTTFSNSEYHTGTKQWELLDIQASVPDAATQIRFRLDVAANKTAYFDAAYASLGPIYRYTIPTSIVLGPHHVYMQYHEDYPDGNYYPLGDPVAGRILRLEGQSILSRPAAGEGADFDTNTTEVDGARVDLIVARAAQYLYEVSFNPSFSAEAETYQDRAAYWRDEVNRLIRQPGVRMVPMSASLRNSWHIEEDATARYLVLDGHRGV